MKEYFKQIYNEGFADTFYLPIIKNIKKIVKNEKSKRILILLTKILYTVLMILIAIFVLYLKWPL